MDRPLDSAIPFLGLSLSRNMPAHENGIPRGTQSKVIVANRKEPKYSSFRKMLKQIMLH